MVPGVSGADASAPYPPCARSVQRQPPPIGRFGGGGPVRLKLVGPIDPVGREQRNLAALFGGQGENERPCVVERAQEKRIGALDRLTIDDDPGFGWRFDVQGVVSSKTVIASCGFARALGSHASVRGANPVCGGGGGLVELRGIEPLTSAVRLQRSPI